MEVSRKTLWHVMSITQSAAVTWHEQARGPFCRTQNSATPYYKKDAKRDPNLDNYPISR